jgi:RWP-RK domain
LGSSINKSLLQCLALLTLFYTLLAVARRGTGTCGKPGKKLQLHELQAQFGLGLKEAAARLRVCPTTLKVTRRKNINYLLLMSCP